MSPSTLRIGLIGAGDAGKHHARALLTLDRDGVAAWTALCARSTPRMDSFLREVGAPERISTFTSLEDLARARVCDAVILATPDGLHPEQIERAAADGLAVLVEKPLALSRGRGALAALAARRANVHLQVGYHLRHHAAHAEILRQAPELVGDVRSLFIRWAWPDPAADGWRARGEGARFWSLAALGTHAIDLTMMLSDATEITDVASICEPPAHTGHVDRAAEVSLRINTKGGRVVLAHISVAVTHRASSRVLIAGDAGEMEAIGTLGARGDGELLWRAPRRPPVVLPFEPMNPYEAQLRDFIRRAPGGFAEDPALLTNLDVLDRIGDQP